MAAAAVAQCVPSQAYGCRLLRQHTCTEPPNQLKRPPTLGSTVAWLCSGRGRAGGASVFQLLLRMVTMHSAEACV